MEKKEKGNLGEQIAADLYRRQGYRITERNYSCRLGEIDLIAETEDITVFVEVKLRKNARFAEAREFVDRKKQQKILNTARYYLMRTGTENQVRFDVVEIYLDQEKNQTPVVNQITDAFQQQ